MKSTASVQNQTANTQKIGTKNAAMEQVKLQLAHYLEQQTESTRSLHKWMKRLDAAGLGVIAAAFIMALYVSITWKSGNPIMIPIAWFFFAASPALTMVFVGLHAILLRAFPPVLLPGKFQRFVTGSGAIWAGSAFIVGGLVMAAFWTLFAYSVGTFNLTLLEPLIRILSGVVGVVMTVSILYAIFQKISKSR